MIYFRQNCPVFYNKSSLTERQWAVTDFQIKYNLNIF